MKNKFMVPLAVLSVIILSGCESSQDMFKREQALSENDIELANAGIHCEMMTRTGSNRKTKVCRTKDQMRRDSEEAEKRLERARREVTRSN